jgi:hypothetical protein
LSQRECSSSTSSVVASWVVFSAETRWAPMLGGGYPKIWIRPPNTSEGNTRPFKSGAQLAKEETKNPLKTAHASKVVNPFTRALVPPFIGRRRDFYILKIPSNLRNILVWTCMNVFYILWFAGLISYIYKPTTSSHAKLGLFR